MSTRLDVSPATHQTWDGLSIFMHVAFFMTGIAVLMLGPLLPRFSQAWGLLDSQSGMLFAAQFAGSFAGAVFLRRDLRKTLTAGCVCLVLGYAALALATGRAYGFVPGTIALLIVGFGLGQVINSISLIAGRRYGERRGKALMSLNFTWSAGALLSPLFVELTRQHISLQVLLLLFALAAMALLLLQLRLSSSLWKDEAVSMSEAVLSSSGAVDRSTSLFLVYFAVLFFLYGSLEISVSGWLATFAIRYTHAGIAAGAYCTTMLWAGITVGRGSALLLLRRFSERTVQILGVSMAILTSALLHTVHTAPLLLALAAAIGCSLAPFIPVTASLFIATTKPRSLQAGLVMAMPALGGAVLPWWIGVVSQRSGSLKLALELPPIVGIVLLGLCLIPASRLVAAKDASS